MSDIELPPVSFLPLEPDGQIYECDVVDLADKLCFLRNAVRWVRDQQGDDKCWQDWERLFACLPEGYTPPKRDESVELENCKQYIASCHRLDVEYTSPQLRIKELEFEVDNLRLICFTRQKEAEQRAAELELQLATEKKSCSLLMAGLESASEQMAELKQQARKVPQLERDIQGLRDLAVASSRQMAAEIDRLRKRTHEIQETESKKNGVLERKLNDIKIWGDIGMDWLKQQCGVEPGDSLRNYPVPLFHGVRLLFRRRNSLEYEVTRLRNLMIEAGLDWEKGIVWGAEPQVEQ